MSLSKKLFDDGLTEIQTSFHNSEMTKERANVWYKYSKDIENSTWQRKIANCIKGCRKVPTLADILDIKGYYLDHPKEYKDFEPIDEIEYKPIPKDIKTKMSKLINKIKMPINL